MPEQLPVVDLDEDLDNADWTKTAWDLPPYKSKEFFEQISIEDLPAFRKRPVYAAAVANGLIYDDEWVADWIEPADPPTEDSCGCKK